MNTCKSCKYAKKIDLKEHGQIGQDLTHCYRYPPKMHPVQQGGQMGFMTVRPTVTNDTEACGEHKIALALLDG